MSLVTVDRFYDVTSAQFARMKLEAAGIPVHLHSIGHASLTGADWLGGIRIQVPNEYAEEAMRVLKQLREELGGAGSRKE